MIFHAYNLSADVTYRSDTQDEAKRRAARVRDLVQLLSLHYYHAARCEVVFVGNDAAVHYFRQFPYDGFVTSRLDSSLPRYLWASAKFAAYPLMSAGDLQSDTDVIWRDPAMLRLFLEKSKDHDVVTQQLETVRNQIPWLNKLSLSAVKRAAKLTPLIGVDRIHDTTSVNCGVVMINDPVLLKRYVNTYLSNGISLAQAGDLVSGILSAPSVIADLVLEQQLLYILSAGYDSYFVLDSDRYDSFRPIGYSHYAGSSKFDCEASLIGELSRVNKPLFNLWHSLHGGS